MTDNTVRKRLLTIETLESRELLSVNLDASGDVFHLHSDSASHHIIYLDFNGHITSGTQWNKDHNGGDINTAAYSIDGDASFSAAETDRIKEIWQRVAEDFAPFDVDVTTEEPSLDKLLKTSQSDNNYGVRAVIGGNGAWLGASPASNTNTTGIAYVGLFGSYYWEYHNAYSVDTPAFIFSEKLNGSAKAIAETISHEVGHTLGLLHDGITDGAEYYRGANGWGPIMGSSDYQTLTQWSKGEYPNANNKEDDLAIISKIIPYRSDDHGSTAASATILAIAGNVFAGTGIIERNTDYDYFKFTLSANSTLNINISPAALGPNLDILAGLFDSSGRLIVQKDDQNSLGADFTDLSLDAGTYYLSVSGTGKNTGINGIYSNYGSLGTYSINGLITAVTGLLVELPGAGTVELLGDNTRQARVEWNAVIQDTALVQTVYVVQYRVKNTERWQSVTVKPAKTVQTGMTIGKTLTLKSGTEYEIRIYAKAAKGEDKTIVEKPFYQTSVKTHAVVGKASLAKVPVREFNSPQQLAIRVKNYQTVYSQAVIKTVPVDTVTVTYTFGKTKPKKDVNRQSETLTFIDGVWTGGTVVTFVDGVITISGLKPYTLYTVTALFENVTVGQEAHASQVSSLSARTAKAKWSIPVADIVLTSTEVDGKLNVAVMWSAAGDDDEVQPDSYTVKVYATSGTNLRLVKKITVRNAKLNYEIIKLKIGTQYSISVTPNADATHVAGTESGRVAVTS